MFVKDVTVENRVGLHARPATFFIQRANEYKSSIWVEKEDRRVNAKSLLGVLSLGIMGGTDTVSYTHLVVYVIVSAFSTSGKTIFHSSMRYAFISS